MPYTAPNGNNGFLTARVDGDNQIMIIFEGYKNGYNQIRLNGKTSPCDITFNDSGYDQWSFVGLTNVVISWSENQGMYQRVHNKTKFPVKVGGYTVTPGAGICLSNPGTITVDTSSATTTPTIKITNLDAKHQGYASSYGRIVVEETLDIPTGDLPMFSKTGEILHSVTNSILYANYYITNSTDVIAYTCTPYCEWKFDQSDNGKMSALINTNVVCVEHSASHFIPHNVMHYSNTKYWDRTYDNLTCVFSMSMQLNSTTTDSSVLEKSCYFRAWFGAESFDKAPVNQRVSKAGVCRSTIWFKAIYNKHTEKWTISAL
jgi:hypothetical protein